MDKTLADIEKEIDLLKQALRQSVAECEHFKFCKEILESTKEVMALNIELQERMLRERDSELIVWKMRAGRN